MTWSKLLKSIVPGAQRLVQKNAASVIRSEGILLKKPNIQTTWFRNASDEAGKAAETVKLSSTEKFKRAVMEYGPTLLVFHISMSLISLGMWYLLVRQLGASEIESLITNVGLPANSVLASVGTFGIAYAGHKATAPVRIGISLTVVPIIVRVLKNKGIMKYENGKLVIAQIKQRRMR